MLSLLLCEPLDRQISSSGEQFILWYVMTIEGLYISVRTKRKANFRLSEDGTTALPQYTLAGKALLDRVPPSRQKSLPPLQCSIIFIILSILCRKRVWIEVELLLQNRPPLFLWSLQSLRASTRPTYVAQTKKLRCSSSPNRSCVEMQNIPPRSRKSSAKVARNNCKIPRINWEF